MPSHFSILQTSAPYHLLVYSYIFGTTAFHSFFVGPIAFRALSPQNFSALQERIFPRYFLMQSIGAVILMVLPKPFGPDAWHWSTLGVLLAGSAANMLFIGPRTTDIIHRRRAQEELEGKSAKDPTASDEMKALNRQFGKWHGISALSNLAVFLSLLIYGVLLADGLTSTVVV